MSCEDSPPSLRVTGQRERLGADAKRRARTRRGMSVSSALSCCGAERWAGGDHSTGRGEEARTTRLFVLAVQAPAVPHTDRSCVPPTALGRLCGGTPLIINRVTRAAVVPQNISRTAASVAHTSVSIHYCIMSWTAIVLGGCQWNSGLAKR